MIEATGWAVVNRGEIDVRTVSDTRRAALINWLCVNGVIVWPQMTDEVVEQLWAQKSGKAICTTVSITYGERDGVGP